MERLYRFTKQQLTEFEHSIIAIKPILSRHDRVLVNKILFHVQMNGTVKISTYNYLYEILMKYSNQDKNIDNNSIEQYITHKKDISSLLENIILPDEAYYPMIELCRMIVYDTCKKNDNTDVNLNKGVKLRRINRNGI